MTKALTSLTSTAITAAIIYGIYIASAAGPCGSVDRFLGFCGM